MAGLQCRRRFLATVSALLTSVLIAATAQAMGTAADNVGGQIDFVHKGTNFVDGRGFVAPVAVAVSPAGEVYVADYINNRILGWRSSIEFAGNQAADIVVGQPDFYSSNCNQIASATTFSPGSPGAATLCGPQGLAVDNAGDLYIADGANNRVLFYSDPFALFPAKTSNFTAQIVFGQGNAGNQFATNQSGLGTTSLNTPEGVAVDGAGNLFVLDANNNRILEYFNPLGTFNPATGTGDVTADFVFGQPNFKSNLKNQGGGPTPQALFTSGSLFNGQQAGLAVDRNGNLYAADPGNNRVVEYSGPFNPGMNLINDPSASLTIAVLASATGIAVDGSGMVYVASNYTIYGYLGTNNTLTIGSSLGIENSTPLAYPGVFGLATDSSDNLYVADMGGNRLLEYFAPGTGAPMPPGSAGDAVPDQVLGQIDFTEINGNFVDGRGWYSVGEVALDRSVSPNRIYVLDAGNNRVLGWKSLNGFLNHLPADLVVGQVNFNSYGCNQSLPLVEAGPTAQSLCPGGDSSIAIDQHGNLLVADGNNSRVLEFSNPFAALQNSGQSSNFTASTVFGQDGSFTSPFCNLGTTSSPTAGSLCLPSGLAFDSTGNLYVWDTVNFRVLEFQPDASGSFGSIPIATAVFGQNGSFTTRQCGDGTFGTPPPSATNLGCSTSGTLATDPNSNLYIADPDNNRVLEFTPVSPGTFGNNPAANRVFGQGGSGTNFAGNACLVVASDTSLCNPAGVATDSSGNLYIADLGNSRVLEYDESTQPPVNVTANRVFGQPSFNTVGGACTAELATADDMCPAGVASDSTGHLYVADGPNSRILEFDSPLAPPPVVALSATTLNYGNQLVGTSSSGQTVTVSNVGGLPLNITNIAVTGTNTADFSQTNNCTSPVAAGSTCSISAIFAPTTAGVRSASLTITDNANFAVGSKQTVSLSGTGTDFTISVSPTSQTIPSGHVATYTATLASVSGFTGNLLLSCIGGPPNSTCSITPPSAALSGSQVVVTANISLQSSKSVNHGTFPVTIAASAGKVTRSATASLTVK